MTYDTVQRAKVALDREQRLRKEKWVGSLAARIPVRWNIDRRYGVPCRLQRRREVRKLRRPSFPSVQERDQRPVTRAQHRDAGSQSNARRRPLEAQLPFPCVEASRAQKQALTDSRDRGRRDVTQRAVRALDDADGCGTVIDVGCRWSLRHEYEVTDVRMGELHVWQDNPDPVGRRVAMKLEHAMMRLGDPAHNRQAKAASSARFG